MSDHPSAAEIQQILLGEKGNYGCLIKQGNFVFAAVDRIRSYPLFYTDISDSPSVSNCARILKEQGRLDRVDRRSLLEFSMGRLCPQDGKHLPGPLSAASGRILALAGGHFPQPVRYYRYAPCPDDTLREGDLVVQLDVLLNKIFERLVEQANGDPICVPLSGGLDSRLGLK